MERKDISKEFFINEKLSNIKTLDNLIQYSLDKIQILFENVKRRTPDSNGDVKLFYLHPKEVGKKAFEFMKEQNASLEEQYLVYFLTFRISAVNAKQTKKLKYREGFASS